MSAGDEAEMGGSGFRSLRSIWQERAKAADSGGADKATNVGPPKKDFQRRGSDSQPPPSPSSRANVLLSDPAGAGAFSQFGLSFQADSFGALVIRKITPGGPADLVGKLFPGDTLQELNGLDVGDWPLSKVEGLVSGDRKFSTLRLGVSRVGVQGLLNVELDPAGTGKARPSPNPSPNLGPASAKSAPSVPPLPSQVQSAPSYPEGARPRSAPAPRPPDTVQDAIARPTPMEEEVQLQVSSEEDEPTALSSAQQDRVPAPQDQAVDDGANANLKDDMRANVVRKYKARIEELSQGLEAAQVGAAQQRRQMEELHRGVTEKDELLREARETLSKMTLKLEETSRERAQARWALQEQHAQMESLQQQLQQSGGAGGASQSTESKAWEESLREEVVRLTREIDALRTERDVAALSAAPAADPSDLVREMKLQLIEKDAKIQELESQAASLKRNNVIQAVELQELHDHVSGMERQKMVMQVQQFPALPALTSVQESPYESEMDDDDKMKAIILADEALQKAQQEMAALKAADEKRVQLEFILANSQREVNRLREQLAERERGSSDGASDKKLEELHGELAGAQAKLTEARSSLYGAQTELGDTRRKLTQAEARIEGLEEMARELPSLRQVNMDLVSNRQVLQQQIASLQARSHQLAPVAPPAAGPDGPDQSDAAHQQALIESLEGLERKQQQLHQHLARIASAPPSAAEASPDAAADVAAERDKVRVRDEILYWVKSQLVGVQQDVDTAVHALAASHSKAKSDGDAGGEQREVRQARELLEKVAGSLREVSGQELEGYGTSPLVQQVAQLRAQLKGQDLALQQLTHSVSQEEHVQHSTTNQLVGAMQQIEALKAQLEEAARTQRLLQGETDMTKEAYASAREQLMQLEAEVRMLRSQSLGAGRGAEGSAAEEVVALQVKLREQERERERLSVQLAEERHSRSVLQEALTERNYHTAPTTDYSAQLFDSLIAEKRGVEEELDKLREEKRFVERMWSNARMDISRLETSSEQANAELHEAQKSNAKLEGKLQAAQNRVTAAEKDVSSKKADIASLNDQLKRLRQNIMQSGSELGFENSTLRTELTHAQQENLSLRQRLDSTEEILKQMEAELQRARDGAGHSPTRAQTEIKDVGSLQHKLGVLAEQLKAQKERAAQAQQQHEEAAAALANAKAAEQEARQAAAAYEQEALALREAAAQRATLEMELQQKMDQVETLSAIIRRLQQQPSPTSPKPAGSPPSSTGSGLGLPLLSHESSGGGTQGPGSGSLSRGGSGANGRPEADLDRVYRHDGGEGRKDGTKM